MKIFHTISELRTALNAERKAGKRIGFVPTMGNLHNGHISLIKQAQTTNDVVVSSIFVNGLQFGAGEDLDKYPRTFQDDCGKLEAESCDYLFAPDDQEMYPNGMELQTRVNCPIMTDVLCGASRPGHFDGVTTVVTKLFNIVQPDEAVFGSKDFQQLAVIRRMAEDLCMPIEITAAPTHREVDGLAMSSRNGYLSEEERPRVTQLYKSLSLVVEQVKADNINFLDLEKDARQKIEQAGFKVDYLSLCNAKTLQPAEKGDKELVVLGAMFTSGARLIDNIAFSL
ncbi:MAG: pantoate--beta-alanine ligase [Cellvibrionaceae bacterium]